MPRFAIKQSSLQTGQDSLVYHRLVGSSGFITVCGKHYMRGEPREELILLHPNQAEKLGRECLLCSRFHAQGVYRPW